MWSFFVLVCFAHRFVYRADVGKVFGVYGLKIIHIVPFAASHSFEKLVDSSCALFFLGSASLIIEMLEIR